MWIALNYYYDSSSILSCKTNYSNYVILCLQGQPNRLTGDCDTDVFIVGSGMVREVQLCGTNSGHHSK